MAETHAILEDDTPAARREIADSQYGQYANAEELIRAHVASQSPEVTLAANRQVNELASQTLDLSSVEVPEGGTLLDAVVRGSYVSFVYETEDGHVRHGATAYDPGAHAAEDETDAAQKRAEVLAKAQDRAIEAEAAGPGGAVDEEDDDDEVTGTDQVARAQRVAASGRPAPPVDSRQAPDDAEGEEKPKTRRRAAAKPKAES